MGSDVVCGSDVEVDWSCEVCRPRTRVDARRLPDQDEVNKVVGGKAPMAVEAPLAKRHCT